MNRILVASTLSLALLSGTALAQVSVDSDANGGVSIGVTGSDSSSATVGINVGAAVDAAGNDGDGAVGGAVDAGVGVAASDGDGNSVGTGVGAGVGVAASGDDDGDGSLSVDGDVGGGLAASSDDGDNLDADLNANTGVAASTIEDEDEVDASTTASIDPSSRLGVSISELGDDGRSFFVDANQTEVVADSEFAAAFQALTPAQQDELRSMCDGAVRGQSAAAFCAAVKAM